MSEDVRQVLELEICVSDMSCDQCERNVEAAVLAVDGVSVARADAKTGKVNLCISHEVRRASLVRAIREAGYTVAHDSRRNALYGLAAAIAALALAELLMRSGVVSTTLPVFDTEAQLGLGGYALVGLLTSVHCISMCGGLVALGVVGKKSGASQVIAYNLGRLLSYTLLGSLLGALGSVVAVSTGVRVAVGVVAAVVMLLVGAALTGFMPWTGRLLPLLPASLRRCLVYAGRGRPFVVGLANGLMPCGPLQAMQLVAVASGSAMLGAASLAAFCAGTVPLMLVFGLIAEKVSSSRRRAFAVSGGVVVMAMGITMFLGNLSLAGIPLPGFVGGSYVRAAEQSDVQVVRSNLEPGAYPNISVRANVPVRWEINAPANAINGCNNVLVMPAWDIEASLTEGTNIIEFTPNNPGEYPYSCWMGMIRATVTVT